MGTEFLDKFDIGSTVANAIVGGPGAVKDFTIATGVETVATLWNSVTPDRWNIETESILNSVNEDALKLLQENPGAVHLASSIAGGFVPGGIAMKLISKARTGAIGLGFSENALGSSFMGSKQRAISKEIETVFREAGPASAELKTLRRQLFASNISQQVADNMILELAVMGGLNAHPWMEDYWEDPLKNFAIGAGVGGVIGAGFALPMTNRAFRNITGKIETAAASDVLESGIQLVHPSFTNVARLQAHNQNVTILETFIADTTKDRITRDLAEQVLIEERAAATQSLLDAAPFLKDEKISKEFRNQVSDLLADPQFIGVDQIRIFNMDKTSKVTPTRVVIKPDQASADAFNKLGAAVSQTNKTVKMGAINESFLDAADEKVTVFVRLGTKEVFDFAGGRNAALAADMPNIKVLLSKEALGRDIKLAVPVRSWGEDLTLGTRTSSSARQNAEFLQELVTNDKIEKDRLAQIIIGPNHLPRMNAVISLLDKLPDAERAAARIRITSDFPSYYAQQAKAYVEKTVAPDYWTKAEAIRANTTIIKGRMLSSDAYELVNSWIDGDLVPLREAMDLALHGKRGHNAASQHAWEIWQAGESTRNDFRKIADSDGYIYLYRKTTRATSHAAVESYTTNPNIRTGTGDTKLFKVHVDNIIASVDNKRFSGEHEIIVAAPHNEIVNNIPTATKTADEVILPPKDAAKQGTIGADELLPLYAETTQQMIRNMAMTQKFSANEISSRLGVSLDGVMHVLGGGELKDAKFQWRMYTDASKIDEYTGERNKLFALSGNPDRNPTAKAFSDLDRKGYRQLHQEQTEELTRSSGSIITNSILDTLLPQRPLLNKLSDDIAAVNNSMVGDPRIQSADNALRNLADGPIVTGVGKLYINTIDKLRKQILEPLTLPFVGLRSKPLALIEFNRVISQLYSMRGWRDIVEDPITGKWVLVNKNEKGDVVFTTKENGEFFFIHQPEVASALNAMREPSKELLHMHDLNRKIRGIAPLNNLGFYVPPINLVNKNYAFVIDNLGVKGTQLLVANNEGELLQQVAAWKKANSENGNMKILLKRNQEADDLVRAYYSGDTYVSQADIGMQHAGTSSLAILPTDSRLLENILQGYETSIIQGGRHYTDHYLRDTTGWLDHMSYYYQRAEGDQPKRGDNKTVARDAAWQVKNVLLGQDQLALSPKLRQANNMTEFLINRGAQALDNSISTFKRDEIGTKAHFDKLNEDLKQIGITEPLFQSFDLYLASTIPSARNIAPSIVSAGNGLVATAGLRFLELSHGLVNMMSLPILTWSALMERLPSTVVGTGGQTAKFPLRLMMDGVRHMFSDRGRALELEWAEKGLIDLTLRQFDDVTTQLKHASMGGGAVENAANAMSSITNNKGIVGLLSGFSDWTERFTRRMSMHTGFISAKHAYPGIDDAGAMIAAMHFADRTVGNYHAAQRPTMFQGTLGAALGLYQTYMLTFAQHIYRGLEDRNFKQLATLMLTQAGIFGMKGLPGYNLISEQVVANFNDSNWDLTTGTYRAVGEPTAELILYGMPSSISGVAFWTRGDISPRIPGSVDGLALVNSTKQAYGFLADMFGKVGAASGDGTAGRAFLESLSLQSLNRPIARTAEILQGASITREGNTVSPADEIYTPIGIGARLLGARPLEEQVTRDMVYSNRFYESRDHDNRQRAMERIKRGIREGHLPDTVISEVAADYLRNGGNAKGWRSVMNDAMLRSTQGARMDLIKKLEPDSPLGAMIGDLY